VSFVALHKRVTFLFAVLGFFVLGRGGELGVVPMLLLGAGTVLAWFAEAPRIDSRTWARNLTIATFAFFAVQIARWLVGGDVLALALEFLGALQLTRLAARRTSTEHLHVVGLGLLHLLAGTLLTTGLDYAAIFVAFLLVTPWMLALTHLRSELERQHATPAELAVGTPPRLARVLSSEGVVRRSFLVLSSMLALPLFAVTAGFFVFFPRVGLGMFTFGGAESTATAGFGNEVDLGRFGRIRDDPTVVIRIFGAPRDSRDSRPRTFRVRGTSFDRFDGVRWSRTPSDGVRREEAYGALLLFPREPRGRPYEELHLIAAPLDGGVVFLPEGARSLRMTPRIESGLTIPRVVVARPGLDLRAAALDGVDLDYVVFVDASSTDVPEPIDDAMRAKLLKVPPGHARLAALAETIALGASNDREIAERIESYLGRSGRFRYSLTTTPSGDRRPLEHFLFESRSGHCELYASAMAIMLRSRGIPARNVTGFLGGRWNAYGGFHAIVQGDAHSWVEAYVDGSFRRYDPTPAERADATPEPTIIDSVRAIFDAMRMRWARDVVGYDMQRQLEVFRSIRDVFRRSTPEERELVSEEPWETDQRTSRPSSVWIVVAVFVAAIGVAFVVVRRRRARAPVDEIERMYRALDRALAAKGLARPTSRTPLEHAVFVRASGFAAADAVERITEAYATARYARAAWTPAQIVALEADLRAIAKRSG